MDLTRLRRDYVDPKAYIAEHRQPEVSMTPPVATIIRPPYGKTYHVVVSGTQAQRDSVYLLASSLGHSATCSGDDGALDLLQVTPNGVTEFKSRTIYAYGVTDQAGFRAFVAGAHPGTVPAVIEFRAWPTVQRPAISFTASTYTSTPGAQVTLSWSATGPVLKAELSPDGTTWTAVVMPGTKIITPGTTARWQLRVTHTDGFVETKELTIVVKPIVTFTASPTSVIAGATVTLSWKVEYINAIYRSDDGATWRGVAGIATETRTPAVTTTYYLRVVYKDNTQEQFTAKVLVTPGPTTPPAPAQRIEIGLNVLDGGPVADQAVALGAKTIQCCIQPRARRQAEGSQPQPAGRGARGHVVGAEPRILEAGDGLRQPARRHHRVGPERERRRRAAGHAQGHPGPGPTSTHRPGNCARIGA